MELSCVNLKEINDEELNELVAINNWVDNKPQTKICVVKDSNDVKVVFCLKEDYDYTGRYLFVGVKEDKKEKEYCTFGLRGILAAIQKEPSIEELTIISDNKLVDIVCMRENLKMGSISRIYFFDNPNFDPKYKILEEKIIKEEPQEDLIEFCSGDKKMLTILKIWLERMEKEKQAREQMKEERAIHK